MCATHIHFVFGFLELCGIMDLKDFLEFFCKIHDCMLDDLSGFHYFFGTIILENSSKITIKFGKK